MKCPKCTNEMIKAKATSFGDEYDYCRTCKKELKEIEVNNVIIEDKGTITKREGCNFKVGEHVSVIDHSKNRLIIKEVLCINNEYFLTFTKFNSLTMKAIDCEYYFQSGHRVKCLNLNVTGFTPGNFYTVKEYPTINSNLLIHADNSGIQNIITSPDDFLLIF